MKKRDQEFLDPNQQHTLTEQECELVGMFRIMRPVQRQAVVKLIFDALVDDARLIR